MKILSSKSLQAHRPSWDSVLAFGGSNQTYVGIDEVGLGAWAGPVVSAAVILPYGVNIPNVKDSKLLSPRNRRQIDRLIRAQATAIGIGWATNSEVDQLGLPQSVRLASTRAITQLGQTFDTVLLDGSRNYLADSFNSFAMVKGDRHLPPVAAASIIAKVARDRYMEQLDSLDACYGYALHKGYGTLAHRAALTLYGASTQHRLTYQPLLKYSNVS